MKTRNDYDMQMNNVFDWLDRQKLFKPNMNVAVGVSGGADSMALLFVMKNFCEKNKIHLFAVNIDHGLRSESLNECKMVKTFCKKNKINYVFVKVDVNSFVEQTGYTIEQGARILRYDAFEKIEKEYNLDFLCLAHHKDDQAETILMHIFRGSGLKGATGMEYVSDKKIVRPFLSITKKDIIEFVKNNDIPFVEDSSNSDEKFTRNYIRKKILPQIEKVYPSVVDNLCKFAENCREDEKYISKSIPSNIQINSKNEIKIFNETSILDWPLFVRTIKLAFEKIGITSDIETKHINLLKNLFLMKTSSTLDMPHDSVAIRDTDGIVVMKKTKSNIQIAITFEVGDIEFFDKKISAEFCNSPDFGKGCLFADYDKIPFSSVWRTKQKGDVFAKLGTGKKKLSDYFTNKKIPLRERNSIPLLCYKNEVLLVAEDEVSDNIKIDSDTERIIKFSFENVKRKK